MKLYERIYYKLCQENVNKKLEWIPFSGLHRHRILPGHSGGLYDDDNITYLTVRQHIIAHFLLWKIHGNANDLRSKYMLGGGLTPLERSIVGKWCYENNIGMFALDKEAKDINSRLGVKTQIENKIGIHNPENFKKYASIGGKASIISPNNPWSYWASAEGRRARAVLGGKALLGRVAMYVPGESSFIRVLPEKVDEYLLAGYVKGSPLKPRKGKKGSTHRRKAITDGKNIFVSLKEAADFYNVTSGTICGRLKTGKGSWAYI